MPCIIELIFAVYCIMDPESSVYCYRTLPKGLSNAVGGSVIQEILIYWAEEGISSSFHGFTNDTQYAQRYWDS